MEHDIRPLFFGFPAIGSSRGPLGWSSAFLISIRNGARQKNFLFDTGGYNERPKLAHKLAEHGLSAQDIDGVIISHLHFDHAVNWMLFENAALYIHPLELLPAEDYSDFARPDFHREQLLHCARLNYVREGDTIEGMRVLEAPGHTPGLIAVGIGSQILASDAIKNRTELNATGALTNTWNEALTRQSIDRLASLADKIYPGHDVPLIRDRERWLPAHEARESVLLADGILDENGCRQVAFTIPVEGNSR